MSAKVALISSALLTATRCDTFNMLVNSGVGAGQVIMHSTELAPGQTQQIVFPREGPGVDYALNWALFAKGVAPKGGAYCNLNVSELKKMNASIPESMKTTIIYAQGLYSSETTDISKVHFNQLYKEVTTSLTRSHKIYVHNGAIGSSPQSDAKVRTISDNPSSAFLFQSILEPAPTRQVSQQGQAAYLLAKEQVLALSSADMVQNYLVAQKPRIADFVKQSLIGPEIYKLEYLEVGVVWSAFFIALFVHL